MTSLPDPAAALTVFAALVLLSALVFWPERGVAARFRRLTDLSDRVRLEDAVKHLFTSAAAGRPSSVDSLAGAIGVSRDRTVALVRHLERMNLTRLEAEGIVLTDDGRAHALRIVRTHRIWERYLADRTGVGPGEWHVLADRLEHARGTEEVEQLAASMGHPLYDPHGDPIPTAAGDLPPARGVPLASLPPGANARVAHIEDEPQAVYQTLRAAGINVGSRLRLRNAGTTSVQLVVDGRPVAIEPLAALNLTVEPMEDDGSDEDLERLDALRPGEEGTVIRVGGQVQGAQRRRLLDLGVVPGTVIRAELRSLSGDPVAYRIRGAMIALRRAQADGILIRRAGRGAA
jgi:DtxR family transcriptional regulator, Mn-dependent transcriptional regulator